jgi:hypothetical protein
MKEMTVNSEAKRDDITERPAITHAKIRSVPQGRCVLCDDLFPEAARIPLVYAGTNPDGTRRLAHRRCWDNMRDQLWLSYGVSLDELSIGELQARQAAKPPLGRPPVWQEHPSAAEGEDHE